MQRELYIKKTDETTPIIQSDDLKFDGKNIIIPSYWVSNIAEYLKDVKEENMCDADKIDFQLFKNFLYSIEEYQNTGN